MAFLVLVPVSIAVVEVIEVAVVATVVVTTTYVGVKVVEETVEVGVELADKIVEMVKPRNTVSTSSFRTIYDWWQNGLTTEEYQKLKDWGYDVRTTCFSLEEVRSIIYFAEKAPGKPPVNAPGWEVKYEPPKKWDGKMKRAPRSQKKGYPHKNGDVWVPTGKDENNPNSHGRPHWDVEGPSGRYGDYKNVFPDGTVRKGRK